MTYYVPETIIERDIDRAIAAGRQSDAKNWVAAFYVYRVWRTYEVDATAHIAQELGKDKSTIENWAHAYDLYRRLRNQFRNANKVRKALTLTHFSAAWEEQRKYNKTEKDIMFDLEQMLNYKKTGDSYSVQALRREIEAHEQQKENTPVWTYYVPKLSNTVTNILAANGCPRELRQAAMMFMEVLKKYEAEV